MDSSISSQITSQALAQGVDPNLALAVANAESGGNQYTSSGNLVTSSAGAIGVFQLEPGTASGLGVDPTDTAQNIQGGVSYLSQMLNQFGGDVPSALAAYNWGPGNVSTYGAAAAPTSTQNYVASILNAIGYSSSSTGSGSASSVSPSGSSADGSGSTWSDLFSGDLPDDSSLPSWVPAAAVTAGAAVLAYFLV